MGPGGLEVVWLLVKVGVDVNQCGRPASQSMSEWGILKETATALAGTERVLDQLVEVPVDGGCSAGG